MSDIEKIAAIIESHHRCTATHVGSSQERFRSLGLLVHEFALKDHPNATRAYGMKARQARKRGEEDKFHVCYFPPVVSRNDAAGDYWKEF
jgi:hypothetical protein